MKLSASFPRPLSLFLMALFVLAVAGCSRAGVHSAFQFDAPLVERGTQVLAVYQPWFGDPRHIDVGYSSNDPVMLRRQIERAQQMGIQGFVVDWYGPSKPFLDSSYTKLQRIASQNDFKVAIMYDESPEKPSDTTQAAIAALDYAYQHYIGPHAPAQSAYLTHNDRPLVFIWPRWKETDWKRVRRHIDAYWAPAPLLIFEDVETPYGLQFDGFYAWVRAGQAGWRPDGSNWGQDYLEGFYQKMRTRYPDKLTVGAVWPGFDDRQASWSEKRYMDPRCGKTFEQGLSFFRRYNESGNIPYLLIVTWNDYEEGTAIERGLADCKGGSKDAGK